MAGGQNELEVWEKEHTADLDRAMLERRRARYAAWSNEYGFPPPPKTGGWQELKEYKKENEEHLEEADILSELKWIHEEYARK